MSDDLYYEAATSLAARVAAREISPVELTDAILDRIDMLEPKLNTFVTVIADHAREDARRAEAAVMQGDALGALHGVPISIKDFIDVAGVRTTFGSRLRVDGPPAAADAVVVERVRAAGAIVVGKTSGSDHGWIATGDSPLTGTTHNPWKLGYSPGGSSSGACASVAAGMTPLAIGTDGAGSVRVPASFCGVFGMKASYGRVPQPGQSPLAVAHTGPISRTVADGALLLQVLAGPHESDPATLPGRPAHYVSALEASLSGKRFAYSADLGFAPYVDPEVAAICADAAATFEIAGAIVEEARPDWGDPMSIIYDFWPALWAGRIGDELETFADCLDPNLVACAEDGLRQAPTTLARALSRRVAYCERTWRFFERYELLLTPTVAVPPFEVGRVAPEGFPQRNAWDWFGWCPFAYPFNLTWHPAATVPAGFTADGRPVGLQIVGRRFDDFSVLQAAAAFEDIRPWAPGKPPLA
jgi:aspartyl-tRNA(Asn)/glutamyl-tRNA(Gln) amidotransferase subunit A